MHSDSSEQWIKSHGFIALCIGILQSVSVEAVRHYVLSRQGTFSP